MIKLIMFCFDSIVGEIILSLMLWVNDDESWFSGIC